MAQKLTPEQVKEYTEAFKRVDTSGDGAIDAKELGQALQKLGKNLSEEELKALISKVDKDGDGRISLQEFLEVIDQYLKGPGGSEQMLQSVFREFDLDGDGQITVAELKLAMGKIGAKVSEEELDQMITEADEDRDGQVNFEEFKRILSSK
ncbi:calmodulin-like protein 3 [Tenrec ecaudatus]|uniref:calmodulin-like protein 3 n=1 Tax=Tenrec ecaudatus TaxID=94439 RepID=UPI003F597277